MSQSIQPTLLAISSQKGGVAKTTSCISIAHKLAEEGHDTLLIDCDPQGHCAISLGLNPEPALFDWLSVHYADDAAAHNAIRATGRPHLSLIPGDSRTRHIESMIALGRVDVREKLELLVSGLPRGNRGEKIENRQGNALSSIFYPLFPDFIVIDTSAGGVLQETAMRLAHQVIIPVRLESLGMDGVAATLGLLEMLFRHEHHLGLPQPLVTILPVMFDKRVSEHSYNLSVLKEKYEELVADPIPQRIAVAEAVAVGKTIWEYESYGIVDVRLPYGRLVERLLEVGYGR